MSSATLDASGDVAVFDRVANGETMGAIADRYGVTRQTLYNWINAGGPERRAAFEVARRQSADVAVEEAGEILDEAKDVTNAAQASVARARADYRRWLAATRDRATYGDNPGAVVNVLNVGATHLDALRRRGNPLALHGGPRGALPGLGVGPEVVSGADVVDAEVLDADVRTDGVVAELREA